MFIIWKRKVNDAYPLYRMGQDRFRGCTWAHLPWPRRCSTGSKDNNWCVGRPVACSLGRSQPFPVASVRMSLLFSNPSHLNHPLQYCHQSVVFPCSPCRAQNLMVKKNSLHYYWGEGWMPERVSIVDSDNSDTANNWIFSTQSPGFIRRLPVYRKCNA